MSDDFSSGEIEEVDPEGDRKQEFLAIPEEWVDDLQKTFDDHDMDQDGIINLEELAALLTALDQPETPDLLEIISEYHPPQFQFADVMDILEQNAKLEPVYTREELLLAFTAFDRKKTGKVDHAQMRAILRENGHPRIDIEAVLYFAPGADGLVDYVSFIEKIMPPPGVPNGYDGASR